MVICTRPPPSSSCFHCTGICGAGPVQGKDVGFLALFAYICFLNCEWACIYLCMYVCVSFGKWECECTQGVSFVVRLCLYVSMWHTCKNVKVCLCVLYMCRCTCCSPCADDVLLQALFNIYESGGIIGSDALFLSFPQVQCHSLIHSFTHSLTHTLTFLFTCLLTSKKHTHHAHTQTYTHVYILKYIHI